MVEPNETKYGLETLLSADDSGPAARIDAVHAERMIATVLDAVYAPPAVVKAPLRSARRPIWLLLAALVITGSAAAMYRAQRAAEAHHQGARTPATESVQPAPAPARPSAVEPAAPVPVAEPAPEKPVAAPPSDVRAPIARSADDLLERANHLRGAGDYRAAERTYLAVIARRPSGPSAYSARVAAAELRLERLNDPKGALQIFAQALRAQPNGALAPEIHEGMAQAYRALGRTGDEQNALRALLAKQASGPAAERARARLRTLDATP